jgi:pentatricopeptide repeat protein
MTEVYKIQPSKRHYSYMIEVLGRAGMFKEAEHFISSVVPSRFGASARSLLCAAKQNGSDKTMELAATKAGSRCLLTFEQMLVTMSVIYKVAFGS